jgi:tRNA threonylcarbamoyl adenosine modification protein YeaZ
MALFLVVYTQYGSIQLGLFDNTHPLAHSSIQSTQASAYLLTAIQELTQQCPSYFKSLDFIAVHQGPAPFTTLRVALATVNGIAFATQLPLVPIDGLQVFLNEYKNKACTLSSTGVPVTPVVMLNAFSNDIYYAYYTPDDQYKAGVSTSTELLNQLAQLPSTFYFVGNAVEQHKHIIQNVLHKRAHVPEPIPQYASLNALAQQALTDWQTNNTTQEIKPLYLKSSSSHLV